MSKKSNSTIDKIKGYGRALIKNRILRHLIFILIVLTIIVWFVLLWLSMYTNHGQKITMPDYVSQHIDEASEDAQRRSFKIIVNDSVHRVGMPGGLILNQNPIAESQVKENRKVYVTTTKYAADKIMLKSLPVLYGNDYDRKKKELQYQDIFSRVKEQKYDSGEPNHILEVWYKGRKIVDRVGKKNGVEINKGDTLAFVISKNSGANVLIQDLICMDLMTARTYLELNSLKIGSVGGAIIENEKLAYIVDQSPRADGISTLTQGEYINVTIAEKRPSNCN